ncbi:MAG: sodium-dependent transporter [Gammaproteobacteria bacterium]|nr:sodium-dependent transporter [Gammaproteobacteria bacterium]
MTDDRTSNPRSDLWSSRAGFILAAAGAAVGLGNVWRFPYITGENGGGAFVLVYLACVCLIGVPLMMAEFFIGRRGASSPDACFRALALEAGRSPRWQIVGTLGVAVSFLILTFYSVIGGWTLAFLVRSLGPGFEGLTGADSQHRFEIFMTSAPEMIFWHTVFMLISAAVVLRGVAHGIERLATYLMPCLLLILLILLAYSTTTPGFGQGVSFMFSFEYSKLTTGGVVIALGHAFFSLALAQSVIVAFGSHLPRSVSLTQASFTISLLDTLVALVVGVVIFSIVFSSGLESSSGPGLVFQSLPVAFGNMPYGHAFGIAFFVMLVLAAWTSSVGLLVPPIEQLEVRYGISRTRGTALVAVTAWLIGILCALSFGTLADFRPIAGKTIYGMLDTLTSGIMMPVTGLLIAVFAGWVVSAGAAADELQMGRAGLFRAWHLLVRFVIPVTILVILVYGLV